MIPKKSNIRNHIQKKCSKYFTYVKKEIPTQFILKHREKKQIVIDKLKYEIENINEVEKKIKK